MLYLIFVLLTLAAAPFVYRLVVKLEKSFAVLEAMLFFLIAGLVVLHILPDAWLHAGFWAIAAFGLAWILPNIGEHLFHNHEEHVHSVSIVFAFLGLALHGLTDGIALSYSNDPSSTFGHFEGFSLHYHPLPLAVVLHTIPASIFIFWVLKPKFGELVAVGALALMALTTVIGYWSASEYLQILHSSFYMGVFEGVAAGSLMHLASHRIKH